MARIALDRDELAGLRALSEADPKGEYWTAHWASGLDFEGHGASLIGATYEGSYSIWKQLKKRKLVDAEGRMTHMTGVALNDKGREALAQAES